VGSVQKEQEKPQGGPRKERHYSEPGFSHVWSRRSSKLRNPDITEKDVEFLGAPPGSEPLTGKSWGIGRSSGQKGTGAGEFLGKEPRFSGSGRNAKRREFWEAQDVGSGGEHHV